MSLSVYQALWQVDASDGRTRWRSSNRAQAHPGDVMLTGEPAANETAEVHLPQAAHSPFPAKPMQADIDANQ